MAPHRATDPVTAAVPGVAAALLVVWALDLPLTAGISTASLTVVASAPLWIPSLRSYRWATAIGLLLVAALLNGAILFLAKSVTLPYSVALGFDQAMHLVGGLGGVGLILWARRFLSVPAIAVITGSALVLIGLTEVPASSNPWKYALSAPVTLLVLALLDRTGPWPSVAALAGLSVVGALNDSRSYVGLCVVTAGLIVFQSRKRAASITWARRLNWIALAGAALVSLYMLGTALLVDGALGEEAQARTQAQIERGGSLISGGRPEWSGTIELAQAHPEGYGLGAIPTYADVWIAREGLVHVGVDTDNGYVDNYMFGGQFKLHSVIADLWAQCGLAGLALAAVLLAATAVSLIDRFGMGNAPPAVIYLGVYGLWNLAFSPIFTALPWVGLALGLLLLRKPTPRAPSRTI